MPPVMMRCSYLPTMFCAYAQASGCNTVRPSDGPAFGQAVAVDEVGIRLLCPAPRRRVELVGKDAHGSRQLHAFRGKESELAFPVQASRGNGGVRQPIERDIVEDVLSRQSLRLPVNYTCDETVAAIVVVEHPGSQPNWGIYERVQCLRSAPHFLGVGEPMLVEEVELVPRALLIGRHAGRRRSAKLQRPRHVVWKRSRHVGVNTE